MSEAKYQPTLPIFERKVSYTILHPEDDGVRSRWEQVRLAPDEIDSIEDERLRESMYQQLNDDEAGSRRAVITFAKPDGTLSHRVGVRRGSIFDRPDENGVTPRELMYSVPLRAEQEEKTAGWISRLLKKR